VIETALISTPTRANDLIFGRTLLERLLIQCERAGIRRLIIEAPADSRDLAYAALGCFRDKPEVGLVDSFDKATGELDPSSDCIRFGGNLVLAQSQLQEAIARYGVSRAQKLGIVRFTSKDAEQGGTMMVGPLQNLLGLSSDLAKIDPAKISTLGSDGILPFALNGRPEDRREAELRLARAVRRESLATDALMARLLDRRVSWRISLWLARLKVAPNLVTLLNTILGLACAAMLASVSYWTRLAGALLFLVSITLDGVDGELARLRMVESRFGGQLDVITDNLVHVAVFIGLITGCYRVTHSSAYIYLLAIMCTGFLLCAISVNRALGVAGAETADWIGRVERATGRDFAYLVVILAVIDRLSWFAWTAAAGTYAFALVLWLLTNRRLRPSEQRTERRQVSGENCEETADSAGPTDYYPSRRHPA
jgi:phosphatidylglycerophosphate synthase